AVVGAHGYVGSALCAALLRDFDHDVTAVIRSNYDEMRQRTFDILINAAMPSKRFWAKTHPDHDFAETVQKTGDLINGWRFGKFVQISSVSARCQLDTVYGRHKAAAEKICGFGNNLVVRLGPMYNKNLSKGVLIDMLEGRKVCVDGESRYCFAPLEFVASWIAANLERAGIVEVGARNAVRLQDVADHVGTKVKFEGAVDHQEIDHPEQDFPDAREVFGFLDQVRNDLSRGDLPTLSQQEKTSAVDRA
ncbi:MAG TPA: NAD-dependent epimerase/dehydratase family protein, partial [Candidatus Binatia bacterium]|nr:NAD-dependent epimerase/dehydratase family protein [Candidatus Binatia bacterium]